MPTNLYLLGDRPFANSIVGLSNSFTVNGGGWDNQNRNPRQLADVNNDGQDDIVGFGDNHVYVSLANGDGTFANPIVGLANNFTVNNTWVTQDLYPRQLGDVNNDGRGDIVGFGYDAVYVSLANGDGTFANSIVGLSNSFTVNDGGWDNQNRNPRQLGDVNNDGQDDIVGFGDNHVYVSLANGDGTFANPIVGLANNFTVNNTWITQDLYPRQLGDVNNDGRDDIVGFGYDAVYVSLANGDGTFANPIIGLSNNFTVNDGGWDNQDLNPRQLVDVNNDGLDDIVGFGTANTYVALANGDGTFSNITVGLSHQFSVNEDWGSQNINPRLVGDVNNDGRADIVGFGNNDVLVSVGSTNNNDSLVGGDGDDTLDGLTGNDTLKGLNGHDLLYGRDGFDFLDGDDGNDSLYGGSGDDILDGDIGNDYLNGEDGNDTLLGWIGSDTLFGGNGHDRLHSQGESDLLYGGSGDDTLYAGGDNVADTLYGNAGSDRLYAGAGHDWMSGGQNNDALYAEDGDDTLYGGSGDDTLDGGLGADTMYGGADNDTYYVDLDPSDDVPPRDRVIEYANQGIDRVIYSVAGGYYSLPDNVENLTLIGTAYGANGNHLNNVMTGNSSNNFFWGNSGNDSLSGGGGNDTLQGYGHGFIDEYDALTGGSGADTFVLGSSSGAFYTDNGYATIIDFVGSQGDKFRVHGTSSDYTLNKTANVSGGIALDTRIFYQGDLIGVVQDTTNVALPTDFIFVV